MAARALPTDTLVQQHVGQDKGTVTYTPHQATTVQENGRESTDRGTKLQGAKAKMNKTRDTRSKARDTKRETQGPKGRKPTAASARPDEER